METLIYFGILLGAYFIGYIHALSKVAKLLYGATTVEKPSIQIYNCLIEKHGTMLYLYDKQSNDFICQGNSLDELAKNALKYKNVQFALVENNQSVIKFEEGKVKQ